MTDSEIKKQIENSVKKVPREVRKLKFMIKVLYYLKLLKRNKLFLLKFILSIYLCVITILFIINKG